MATARYHKSKCSGTARSGTNAAVAACWSSMTRNEITEQIVVARLAKGLTWQQLADAIGSPVVWTTAGLLGQHPIPAEPGKVLVELLGLDESAVPVLATVPYRGGLPTSGAHRPDHLPLLRSRAGLRPGAQRTHP